MSDLRSRLLRIAVLPVAVMALLGVLAAALLAVDHSVGTRYVTLVGALVGTVLVAIMAAGWATKAARAIHEHIDQSTHDAGQWITDLRSSMARGQEEIRRLGTQIRDGQRPVPRRPPLPSAPGSDPLADELKQLQYAAEVAVIEAGDLAFGGDSDQRVAVLVNFARRLQSLIHRAIQKLDELERQVEDPDLLKGLFYVDHLATCVRRQAESLSVLGGAVSRREWSDPVAMYSVLRSAVAEIEQYVRVKVVRPVEGSLHGHAVADIIHLIAELVENATNFSAPGTQVRLTAQPVTAGLAIEIEDRGLGMRIEDQQQLNALLAAPGQTGAGDELRQSGRIGLCVVSELARRHGVAVRLQGNIYGGTDAVVVIPRRLLGDEPQPPENRKYQLSQPAQTPAVASNVQAAVPAYAPSLHSTLTPAGFGQPTTSHNKVHEPSPAPTERRGVPGHLGVESSSAEGLFGPSPAVRERRSLTPSSMPSMSANDQVSHQPIGDGRPPLPHRTKGEQVTNFPSPAPNQPVGPLDHTLMASFQQGMSDGTDRSDDPTRRTDHAN